VLLKEIFVFSFFHWTQRTGISPVCRERDFLAAISENAAIPPFFEKLFPKEKLMDRWLGRTV